MLRDTKDGLIITLRISPNASKNEIIKTDEFLKVKITAQPVDGKANKAVIEFLSKQFKVPKSSFKLLKGHSSKDKTFLIKTDDVSKINEIKSFVNSVVNNGKI